MEIVGTSTLSAVLESLAMFEYFSEYCVMTGRRYKTQNIARRVMKITAFTIRPMYCASFSIFWKNNKKAPVVVLMLQIHLWGGLKPTGNFNLIGGSP